MDRIHIDEVIPGASLLDPKEPYSMLHPAEDRGQQVQVMSDGSDHELRILLYAPGGKDAILAARVLQSAEIATHVCGTLDEVLHELGLGAGALLTMEEALTPQVLTQLAYYLERQPAWSDIHTLVVTREGVDSPDLLGVMDRLRSYTLLERPIRTRALISIVRSVLSARRRQYFVREAEQRKDEFLASLAHELRNPLAPIRSAMGVLGTMYPAASNVVRIREAVERQVEHLTRLVDDLLDVARITSGKIALSREPVALAAIVAHAVEICAPALEAAGHKLTVRQPAGDFVLHVDSVRIVQSLANILGNAIKYTPPGGQIEVWAEVDGECVTFGVKDSGIGLEPADFGRIFDMFMQTNPTPTSGRGTGGLGIGLSLAKRFIEMHGGSISGRSEGLGKGCEFVFTLPVVTPGEPRAPGSHEQSWLDAKAANRKVLVVDDNRDNADMLKLLFEADGFTVTTAYDGHQAVEAAARKMPDVVVMDLGMPGLDGYEAVRKMRCLPGGAAVLMIALSGWGQEAARRRAIEAGFDQHLTKPLDFASLRALLHKP